MLTQAQTAPKHLKWNITILPPPPQTMFMCCFNTKLLPILAQKVKTFCKFYRWHWQLEGWVISGDKCAERYGVPLHLHNQIWPSLEEGCWKSDAWSVAPCPLSLTWRKVVTCCPDPFSSLSIISSNLMLVISIFLLCSCSQPSSSESRS